MKDLLRLLRYVRPYAGRLVAAALCAVLIMLTYIGLFSMVQPIFDEVLQKSAFSPVATGGKIRVLDQVRDLITAGGRSFAPLAGFADFTRRGASGSGVLIAVLVVILFLVMGVFTYLSDYQTRWVGLQATVDLRTDLYSTIQKQSLGFFSDHPTGSLISRVVNDVGRIQRMFSGDLAEIFRQVAIVVGHAAWLFYLNWRLSTFCFILLPLLVYPVARLGSRLKDTSRRSMERMGEAVNVMKEGISGARVVQAFGMEEFETGRFARALRRTQSADKAAARLLSMTPPVMALAAAAVGSILFAYVVYRIHLGKLSPGEASTFISVLFMVFASVKNLVKINNEVQQSIAGARRVFQVMDAAQQIADRPGAPELPPFRGEIQFRNVGFSYGKVPILGGIDLTVRSGQVVALVGSSGAGKSTLVNLLPRFYDVTGGALLVDGFDVREVRIASLRRQIGLVTQEVILFDDTVRNNIAYGRDDIPLERVIEAARAAHAHGFIEALPRGYDTPLGEAGHRLSLGQRQRLSIARAFLKDSPILILDEATSSLDSESEAEVQGALQSLMSGRTVFVIAHRLSTVRRADTIVVLDAGRIVERGAHADLLARQGMYARLHALQFRDEAPSPRASVL
jgi:ATP-binding cassette, subfamily B, bacterial MsbA